MQSTLENLIPGKTWRREARRSAPTRLAPAIIAPTDAADIRDRHAPSRHTHSRNPALPDRATRRDDKTRRQRRLGSARSPDSRAQDDDYGAESPALRSGATFGLPRVGTGDFQDDDDDSDSSYNSFNLSLQKKALFSDESSADIGLGIDEATDTTLLKPQPSAWKNEDRDHQVTVYRIYRSRYEGVDFQNGNLSAQLITGTNRKMFQRELSKPLFRWIHFENPSMNFSTFAQLLLELPYLDEQERSCAAGILKIARQKSDQSLRMPAGKKGMYAEPEYYDETIRQTVFQGFRSRHEKMQFVRWMCLPYFIVGDRSTVLEVATKSNEDLPPTPHFLNSGYVNDGKYYQVAQLWVLMIGNGILFTCARRSVNFLIGNSVNIKTLPPADPERRSVGDRAPVIIVSDGGIRTWLLPVEDCKTWPEFSANFAELDVDLYDGWYLLYQDLRISRRDWPKVIKIAQRSSIRLTLERSDDDDEDDDSMSEGSSEDEVKSKSTSGPQLKSAKESEKELDDPARLQNKNTWHVFTMLATKISGELATDEIISPLTTDLTQNVALDNQVLREDADEIASYLLSVNKRRGERAAYASCPKSTMLAVEKSVGTLSPTVEHAEQAARHVHLFKAVRNIFTFFYPPGFDHEIAQKYWGAAERILQETQAEAPSLFFLQRYRSIRNLSHFVEDMKEELFLRRNPAHHHTNVPHEFIQAWMLCLMHFVLFNTHEAERTSNYVARCRSLLNRGKMNIIQRLQTFTLRDREAVLPLGATALTIGQLIEDARGGPLFPDRHRLTGLYWDELQQLTMAVHDDALNRRHQQRFVILKSELETIISTLEDQQRVLVALDDSINESEANSVIIEGLGKSASRETSVVEFSLQNTKETMANFIDMERRRAELESWRFRVVESAKDRQEKAALTFTTVTVLFLPLTLLASIFGMNTYDIRNMPQKQWLFWVIAAPLSAAGILIWLAYLGTLHLWWKRAMRARDRGTKPRAMRKPTVATSKGKVVNGMLP